MSRVLIIGASGQLGGAFQHLLSERGEDFVAWDEKRLDLSRPDSIALELDDVRVVLNCAAYTNVDGAETDEALATLINADAVGIMATQCRAAGVPLVHYSTDYVFDGAATSPIPVDAPRAPLNAYGRSKAKGEELLEKSGAEYLLVRTSWVYAPWGNNFVKTIARLVGEKPELKVVDDQRGRPTHALGLAERSLALFERGKRGIFHVTDGGECSWYEFATKIRDLVASPCQIHPCTTAEFPRPARRPAYGVLDTAATDAILGPAKHYGDWLATMIGSNPR